jgi:hypothetical protein
MQIFLRKHLEKAQTIDFYSDADDLFVVKR